MRIKAGQAKTSSTKNAFPRIKHFKLAQRNLTAQFKLCWKILNLYREKICKFFFILMEWLENWTRTRTCVKNEFAVADEAKKLDKNNFVTKVYLCLLQGLLGVNPIRTNQKCVFRWQIPPGMSGEKLKSRIFKKFERQWQLTYHRGVIALRYVQGLEPIAIVVT